MQASPALRNLRRRNSAQLLFPLVEAITGPAGVSVTIDKPGHQDAPVRIDHFHIGGSREVCTDCLDLALADEDVAFWDDPSSRKAFPRRARADAVTAGPTPGPARVRMRAWRMNRLMGDAHAPTSARMSKAFSV